MGGILPNTAYKTAPKIGVKKLVVSDKLLFKPTIPVSSLPPPNIPNKIEKSSVPLPPPTNSPPSLHTSFCSYYDSDSEIDSEESYQDFLNDGDNYSLESEHSEPNDGEPINQQDTSTDSHSSQVATSSTF